MSRDLLTQLEAYFADVDELQGPVTEAQVADAAVKVRELPAPAPAPVRRRPRLWVAAAAAAAVIVAIGVVPLIVGSRDADTPPATEPSPPITTATTTTMAELPATTVADVSDETTPTASAWDELPAYVKARGWHVGTYESVGYSCGSGDPDFQCDAPHRANFATTWIGSDQGMDFIDFFGNYDPEAESSPPDSPYSDGMLVGSVDDYIHQGLGHGIRATQLDHAPPGLDIGGEAWIRLTISSLSATNRAERNGKLVPTEAGYRIEAGSEGDPLEVNGAGRLEPTRWIEDVVLVATNDTMSQWIIAFNEPGTYTYTALYWYGTGFAYGLNISFVRL